LKLPTVLMSAFVAESCAIAVTGHVTVT